MAITLGYNPSKTDLTRSLSTGLQMGQRFGQMGLDADADIERQKHQQDMLDLETSREERLQDQQDWRQDVSFPAEQDQIRKDYLAAEQALALERDIYEGDLAKALGRKGSADNIILRELEQSESRYKKVPGKWEFSKSEAQSKMADLDYQLSREVAGLTKQHEDRTLGLRTAAQQDLERFQVIAQQEEQKQARENDIKMLDVALGVVGRYDGDPIALEKTTNAMLESYNPIMREVAGYMGDIGSTSRTSEGLLRDFVNGLPSDAQDRYAGMMIDKAFGPMVTDEKQIDKTAIDLAKGVDNAMDPDMFGPLVTMRSYYDDNELQGSSQDFNRYLKDTLVYTSNAFDRINLAMAYIKEGEVPTKKKKKDEGITGPPHTPKKESKKTETKAEDGRMRVIAPDGTPGSIPVDEWPEYEKKGFKKE